ncbi:MAG: hypothetical protein ACQKBY_08830 [Verrucomicrobiales bacterium]
MPSRGRHQSTSKENRRLFQKIESLAGVEGIIIGRSYGGKSLGRHGSAGSLRLQRKMPGGIKAVTQSAKGIQEIFIRVEEGRADEVWAAVEEL